MGDPNWEAVGIASDTLDNALAASKLPLPPRIHLEGLYAAVEQVRDEIRSAYIDATGEDPWGGTDGE